MRQAGELGGEWSNRAEVESQPNKDYGRLDNLTKKLTLPPVETVSQLLLTVGDGIFFSDPS